MEGRQFLPVARGLAAENDEASLRTAASRAYCPLFFEARDLLARWGFAPRAPFQVHVAVRERLEQTAMSDSSLIATRLRQLFTLRAKADYENAMSSPFDAPFVIEQAVEDSSQAIDLLFEIDGDPGRRAAAIAAVQRVP